MAEVFTILNSDADFQELSAHAKDKCSVFAFPLLDNFSGVQLREWISLTRDFLFTITIENYLNVTPVLIGFGMNISEMNQTICDELGILVFSGFDSDTILGEFRELGRLLRGVETPIQSEEMPYADPLRSESDELENPLPTVTAEMCQKILVALQPIGQVWQEREY